MHHDREAVELAVRQWEGARVLEGVLGRHQEEGVGQGPGGPVDADLVLLHGLQQGSLGAGRGPVDLVEQDDVGEQRPSPELPSARTRLVHRNAGEVGREEIQRPLNAPEAAGHRLGHGLGQKRLGHPRHVLHQEVAARQQGDHAEAHGVGFATDDC